MNNIVSLSGFFNWSVHILGQSDFQLWCSGPPEKGTQKGKYNNTKVQKCRKCEIVIYKNRIIQKSKSSEMQKMWNIKIQKFKYAKLKYKGNLYAAFENP